MIVGFIISGIFAIFGMVFMIFKEKAFDKYKNGHNKKQECMQQMNY